MSQDSSANFQRSYTGARNRFLALSAAAQGHLESLLHPQPGPEGEIYTDIVSWGPKQASRCLVVSSGTHGIEGYAGSGIQNHLIDQGLPQRLPADTRLIMVHGINPHGFAWQRRVNEDNIDLNRNFIDHTQPHPSHQAYDDIADLLEPREWTAASPSTLSLAFQELIQQRGQRWFQTALTAGQYSHPYGQFYGGVEPAWSNQLIREFVRKQLTGIEKILFIDIHTALGKFGEGECIVEVAPNSAEFHQAQALWGSRVLSTVSGDSQSAQVSGSMLSGVRQELGAPLLGTGLEFGTLPSNEVILALVADQWLHRYGQIDSPLGRAIKARMMEVFCPDSDEWRSSITRIATEVVDAALPES